MYSRWPWKTSALLSLTGCLLFIASAVCLLQNWSETKSRNSWQPNTQRLDFLCGAGSVAVVTAIVLLVDFIFTVRQGVRGDLD